MLRKLGRYVIESELGKGGMGIVYQALDERLGKKVAIKLLSEETPKTPDSRSRLRREARAAAILNHPSIVAVYDYDEIDGQPFIVYELVEGRTLAQVIADGPAAELLIIEVARQVAGALAYAHERGILHRDIKPQNIILTSEGTLKVLDYGLAKNFRIGMTPADGNTVESLSAATAVGTIVGTVQYMSPEQIGGEALDGRSDIFSLGIVLYEMASGKNPFLGQNLASTIGRIMSPVAPTATPEMHRLSPALWEIIDRCLKKGRDERYSSAQAVLEDLKRMPDRSTRPVRSRSQPQNLSTPIPRQPARLLLILLQFLYLGLYAVALMHYFDVFTIIAHQMIRHTSFSGAGVLHWARFLSSFFLVSGCCGIPIRLFIVASVGFDDPETGKQFRRLYPSLFFLDEFWALSPLLLEEKWSAGLTLICAAILAYLPISHVNLIRSAYPVEGK